MQGMTELHPLHGWQRSESKLKRNEYSCENIGGSKECRAEAKDNSTPIFDHSFL
jgi:hypothetical protein